MVRVTADYHSHLVDIPHSALCLDSLLVPLPCIHLLIAALEGAFCVQIVFLLSCLPLCGQLAHGLRNLAKLLIVNYEVQNGPKAGSRQIHVTWSLDTAILSVDNANALDYKILSLKLCFGKISQVDQAWRNTVDLLAKDKTCLHDMGKQNFTATGLACVSNLTIFGFVFGGEIGGLGSIIVQQQHEESASVATHINDFDYLFAQICVQRINIDDEMKAIFLLCLLPPSWDIFCTAANNSAPNGTLVYIDVTNSLLSEEMCHKAMSSLHHGKAHYVQKDGKQHKGHSWNHESKKEGNRDASKGRSKSLGPLQCSMPLL
ncbi:hypothetical protein L7F22_052501 [Adiantum nelumboides]|nr:hypothetical protein [Adiantum nelumboides]